MLDEFRIIGKRNWINRFNDLRTHEIEKTPSGEKKKGPKVSEEKENTGKENAFGGILEMEKLKFEIKDKAYHNDAIIERFLADGLLKIDKSTVSHTPVSYDKKAQPSAEKLIIVRGTVEKTPVTFRIWESDFPGFYDARFIIHKKESRLIFISSRVKELLVGK